MPPTPQEQTIKIFTEYEINCKSTVKEARIFTKLSEKYKKTPGAIKTCVKKHIIELIAVGKITPNDAEFIYGFPELNKKEEKEKEQIAVPEITLSSINDNINDLLNRINVMHSDNTKKDKQIECLIQTVQKLISSKDPEKIVQSIREKRKEEGTEYVEPVRPNPKSKPIIISQYDSTNYKIKASFDENIHIRKIAGCRWRPDPEKFWTIPKTQITNFEKILKEASIVFEIDDKTAAIVAMVPDNDVDGVDGVDDDLNTVTLDSFV